MTVASVRPGGPAFKPPAADAQNRKLAREAKKARLATVVEPMREVWDNKLRNAIFHSDYSRHLGEVRFKQVRIEKDGTPKVEIFVYENDKIITLVNRACP
jgi:hypothetical protein